MDSESVIRFMPVSRDSGPVNATGMAATGAGFAQFEERGETDTGCIFATSDEEMGKTGPRPSGLRRKSAQTFVVILDSGVATAFGLRLV